MRIRYLNLITPQLWLGLFLSLLPSLLWAQEGEVVKKGEVRLSSTRTGASGGGDIIGILFCIDPDSFEIVEVPIKIEIENKQDNSNELVYLEAALMDPNGQVIWTQSPILMTREIVQNARDTLKQSLAIDLSQFNGSIASGKGKLEIRALGEFPIKSLGFGTILPPTYVYAVYAVCISQTCNCDRRRPMKKEKKGAETMNKSQ